MEHFIPASFSLSPHKTESVETCEHKMLERRMRNNPNSENFIQELEQFYWELVAEIHLLAKPTFDPKEYADPTHLSPVERRLFVRSVFSFFEAVSFILKRTALIQNGDNPILAPGEIALALEEDYELEESGELKIRSARLRFRGNIRFAFKVVAKAYGVHYPLDVSGSGWQALSTALDVRDRLMHPKQLSDLVVTDSEVRSALHAFTWLYREHEILMGKIVQSFLNS